MRKRMIALSLVAFAASCSVVDTYDVHSGKERPSQAAGTYYLPKQLVQIKLTIIRDKKNGDAAAIEVGTLTVPDKNSEMEVGLKLSPFADDNIQVSYSYGMLASVSAEAIDRSAEIAVALARDAALFRSGENEKAAASPTVVTKFFQFDPYDPQEAWEANEGLRMAMKATMKKKAKPTACVEVEIEQNVWSPGCGADSGVVAAPSEDAKFQILKRQPGIYYRRAVPHLVRVKMDGRIDSMIQLAFANNGPVYRLDIKRTAFVTRKTTVTFTSGELVSVSVNKNSEALAVATLPVSIVDAYLGTTIDMLTRRKNIQEARANYYNALSTAITNQRKLNITQNTGRNEACQLLYPEDASVLCQ